MPDGGKLTFDNQQSHAGRAGSAARGVDHPGDYVVVEVTDTGTGIPDAIHDRIFEPFFSTKETGQGTGLGLSMVFGFAKQSGGNIEVRSEPGRGTSFRIYLPQGGGGRPSAVAGESCHRRAAPKRSCAWRMTPSVRASVVVQLQSLGYKVLVAVECRRSPRHRGGGGEIRPAVHRYRHAGKIERPAARRGDGAAAASLRVLFTSGYTYDALGRHGQVLSDIRLLVKPYRRAELARMLRLCLDPLAAVAATDTAAVFRRGRARPLPARPPE